MNLLLCLKMNVMNVQISVRYEPAEAQLRKILVQTELNVHMS